jgi:hypothetical protein
MRRVKLNVSFSAALVMAAALSGFSSPSVGHVVEQITGIVQDWSPERGYVVVDGVRYQTSDDVQLVDESGMPISLSILRIGIRVSLLDRDGVVYQIALVGEDQ